MLPAIFLSFAILYTTHANSLDELCTTNKFTKEAGHYKHPTDCDKFVQCHWELNRLVADVRPCSFPTLWNTDLLTCGSVDVTTCNNDRCKSLPDGIFFGGHNNCRGFWECEGGRSQPKCCPLGQRFDKTDGCIDTINEDDECKDSCMGIVYESKNDTTNNTKVCEKEAIPKLPGFYRFFQLGWGFRDLPCPPGTNFDQDACDCITATVPAKKAECKPEIHLTFTDNQTTSNGHFLDAENVMIKEGVAEFNGIDSRLSIPRFNNIEHSKSLVIRMTYNSTQEVSQYPQVILSNSGCGILPSVRISENVDNVMFEVGTTRNFMVSTSVKQPSNGEKTVELKFANGVLMGSVNNETSAIAADGFLRNVHCTLNIGYDQKLTPFKGVINELSVYLCDPEQH